MVFSYNWLQSFFTKKLPVPEKLAKILTMRFAEVEEVKKSGGDFILDIGVLPNRAGDCLSHIGIAREIAAITNTKLQIPGSKSVSNSKIQAKKFVSVQVNDKIACPRYTAKVIVDIKVGPSPKWLQERLAVCGLNPINNVVDVANYVMLETGQPMHAFDAEKLTGKKIIVRRAKKGEKIITLDGQKFDLNPNILIIADTYDPVAIAGIKGGKIPEVNEKTKTIVLESANFNPKIIRKCSKALGLKTDASLRFEHGVDPNLTEFAINRAVYLIQKVAGGGIVRRIVDVYPKKVYPKIIKLDLDYVDSSLGAKIPSNQIKNILTRLGFKIKNLKLKILDVEVPTRRLDANIQEDLIEEIGRIYGYNKILPVLPIVSLVQAERGEEVLWKNMVVNALKEVGFTEVYNYAFIGEDEVGIFRYGNQELIELANPPSKDQKYLRPSLIPNLLRNVQKNQNYFSDIKIFELGKVFQAPKSEQRILNGVLTGDKFYEVKGVVDLLLNKLGISDIWYDDFQISHEKTKISIWDSSRSAEIKIGNAEKIGFLGEIAPEILQQMKITGRVVAFEIDFNKLQRLASEEHEYQPLSKFPSAVRDLAVLVPFKIRVEQVLNEIETAGGELVRDVDLFDIYEGEELPEGQKNLAFHIIYQSETKTLASKEVDEIHQTIIKTLEKNSEWQVRK